MKKLLMATTIGLGIGSVAYAASDSKISWRYQDAETGTYHTAESILPKTQGDTNNPQLTYSDVNIKRTLFVKDLGLAMQNSIDTYQDCTGRIIPEQDFPMLKGGIDESSIAVDFCYLEPLAGVDSSVSNPKSHYRCPWTKNICAEHRLNVSNQLNEALEKLQIKFYKLPAQLQDEALAKTIDLGFKLAKNMKDHADFYPYEHPYWRDGLESLGGGAMPSLPMSAAAGGAMTSAKGLTVTAGGAQDFGFIKSLINDGDVPQKDAFLMEGFLSTFDLSLTAQPCAEIICIQPAVAADLKNSKFYVQISMNSAVTAETFERPALNLSLVIDISGSMEDNDGTMKSRLEWAKEAAIHTVNQLNENDFLSVVVFDTNSEIMQSPINMSKSNRESVTAKIAELVTRGSTNLEAGLRDGYMLTSKNFKPDYQNRVILISDAGLNTGVTDDAPLLKLVTDFANENIGMTAIGLGLNFNQDFINHISQSRSGNYIFVHSGEEMFKFFKNFDFLVTPVAYNFKASIELANPATLSKVYGIPMPKDLVSSRYELLDIQTLFFAGEGGGAILLEYEMIYE